jgi:multidrug efflux pump subunit AcrA (membrane-fusion protein)
VTILPVDDQEIRQGDELRVRISTGRGRYARGQLTYSLSDAPPDATIDKKLGVVFWPTTEAHKPGKYRMVVKVLAAGPRPRSDAQAFTVRLRRRTRRPDEQTDSSDEGTDLSFEVRRRAEQAARAG